jgi:spermidine synthase
MNLDLLLWVSLVFLIVSLLAIRSKRQSQPYPWLYIVFFFSGFSALTYQIVWQRALFAIYGVNIESVTIVVTAFMLGLGLGSLLGGYISRQRLPMLVVFGLAELGIAGYGLISLRLFRWVAIFTGGASLLGTGIFAFLLVLLPTLLMGCTLPLLAAQMVQLSGNVGQSVAWLYCVNTLGSAIGSFFAAEVAMRELGQSGSVSMAALLNGAIGISVLLFSLRLGRKAPVEEALNRPVPASASASLAYISFPLALGIATAAGFVALAYEIVWYRVFSYATAGLARTFPLLLGAYLTGTALGSFAAEVFCRKQPAATRHWMRLIGLFIIFANVVGYLVIPFLVNTRRWLPYRDAMLGVTLAAGLLGAVFPLVAHAAIPPDARSGARLSYLYIGNILGSAAGSFLVGFVVMDLWPLPRIAEVLAWLGLLIGAVLLPRSRSRWRVLAAAAGCVALATSIGLLTQPLFDQMYEKLYYSAVWTPDRKFQHVVETRSGVVNVTRDGTVIGGGLYDGMLNTDPHMERNWIVRAYALSGFHANPRQILMVGLASGAWAEVIANHPAVEKVTIVEINPGYLSLLDMYPQVAGLLKNPKVEMVIDDGRRWLQRNPDKKFDMIVMDTTAPWRSQASGLLSTEFLRMVRRHLNPGGVHYYNTLEFPDVLLTGTTEFPYALRVCNFLAVSDSPITVDKERWRRVLLEYKLEGRPVFDPAVPLDRAALEKFLSLADIKGPSREGFAMEYADGIRQRSRGAPLITDDDMGDEWRF